MAGNRVASVVINVHFVDGIRCSYIYIYISYIYDIYIFIIYIIYTYDIYIYIDIIYIYIIIIYVYMYLEISQIDGLIHQPHSSTSQVPCQVLESELAILIPSGYLQK